MSKSKPKSPRVYYGWYILGTAMFIAFVTTGARNGFGVFVIPMSEEFRVERTTISVVAAVGWLVQREITQPFLGHFFDRFSARRVILVSLVVVGASTAALSLTFHVLFLAFIFGFVLSTGLSGASTGTLQPLLARWFQRRRTTMMGFIVAGSSVGGLILVPFLGVSAGVDRFGGLPGSHWARQCWFWPPRWPSSCCGADQRKWGSNPTVELVASSPATPRWKDGADCSKWTTGGTHSARRPCGNYRRLTPYAE